jgi:hypothetical protein
MPKASKLAPECPNSTCYYAHHATKLDYDQAFDEARQWALKHPAESARTAARIFKVKEEAFRKSMLRLRKKERSSSGLYNQHGGNNKVLNKAQEEAIRQYCYEQWEMGLGATHSMVQAAIKHLKEVRSYILFLRIC